MKPLRRLLSHICTPTSSLGSPSPNFPSIEIPPERSPPSPGDPSHLGVEQSTSLPGNNQRNFFQGVRRVDINQATFVQSNDSNAAQAESSSTFVNQNAGSVAGANSCPRKCTCETSSFRAPYEIYYEELLKQKRGSPLWFPGPSSNAPVQYRHNGVNVGDVGIFRIDEPYDFLFNIFLPADDPINAKGVPEDFRPLELGETFEELCDPNSGCIGSSLVFQLSNRGEQPALAFETSASEGAILVLPEGADRKVVRSLKSMKDYMTPSTIQNCYRYAMDVRERDVQNGDIRLVYACDKAASWGIATFSSVEGNTTSFVFNQTKDFPSGSHTYNWRCNGSANTHMRVGPSVEEEAVRNQCIFLQTWNAQLSAANWRRMQGVLVQADDHTQCPLYTYDHLSWARQSNHSDPARNTTKSSVMHPSSRLNQSLPDSCQNAEMAVTTDDDWMSLMTEDGELPTDHQLASMIQRSHRMCIEDGVVSLDRMKYNEDENEVGVDIQKAGSLLVATSSNGSEPLPGLQRASDEEFLGLPGSYPMKPLEDFESRTLPNVDIGKSPSLTQLPRNFADVDMNSRWTVIALTLVLAYIYPSMRFLPLITLTTTLVHQSSVANLTKRTAPHTFLMESWRISNWKMSSGNHVHSEIDKQLGSLQRCEECYAATVECEHLLTSLARNFLHTFVGCFTFQRWYLKKYSWKPPSSVSHGPQSHWKVENSNYDCQVVTLSIQYRETIKRLMVIWDLVRGCGMLIMPLPIALLQLPAVSGNTMLQMMAISAFLLVVSSQVSACVFITSETRLQISAAMQQRWINASIYPKLFLSIDFWSCLSWPVTSFIWSISLSLLAVISLVTISKPDPTSVHTKNDVSPTLMIFLVVTVIFVISYRIFNLIWRTNHLLKAKASPDHIMSNCKT